MPAGPLPPGGKAGMQYCKKKDIMMWRELERVKVKSYTKYDVQNRLKGVKVNSYKLK